MLNAEKYKDEIEKILDYDFTVTKESREIVECGSVECDDCLFYENENEDCDNNRIKWLISEAKEKILDSEGNVIEVGDLCLFWDNDDYISVGFFVKKHDDNNFKFENHCQSLWTYCRKTTLEKAQEIIKERFEIGN